MAQVAWWGLAVAAVVGLQGASQEETGVWESDFAPEEVALESRLMEAAVERGRGVRKTQLEEETGKDTGEKA